MPNKFSVKSALQKQWLRLKNKWRLSRRATIAISIAGLLLLILIIPGSLIAVTAQSIKSQSATTRNHAVGAYQALKSQDLPTAKVELEQTLSELNAISSTYHKLSFLNYSPLHWHYQDGLRVIDSAKTGVEAGQILVNAVEPYADILGLTGQESVDAGSGTAEQRISTIIETLPHIIPELDKIQAKVDHIDQQIGLINPARYPFKVNNQPIADLIAQAKTLLHQTNLALIDYRPVIEQLPSVAGAIEPQTYLILFQNDGELRPTGGFITAYSQVKVEQGKVIPERSDDIYELDQKFRSRIEAPEPILTYLDNVPYWNLRDMNLSPDFKTSMDLFSNHYVTVPGEPEHLDGIIAVDTQVLTHLIEVLGPVEVPGYGIFTAEIEPRCDCPQVVYALENMITRPTPYHRSDRKGVLGPLMQSILRKAYDAPSDRNPALFQAIFDDIKQKHILFYFTADATQKAAEAINVAGRIHPSDVDYLHINDANLGGAKSNMFTTQEVEQKIDISETGAVTKTVTVAYKNPQEASNCNLEAGQLCLNGVLRNWVRFYVPAGSELVDSAGFQADSVKTSEDMGKMVIEGFFTLDPLSQAKIEITYHIPYRPDATYRLQIQKQPGSKNPEHVIMVGDHREELELTTDQTLELPL